MEKRPVHLRLVAPVFLFLIGMTDLEQFEQWFVQAFGPPPVATSDLEETKRTHEEGRKAFEVIAKNVRWEQERQMRRAPFVGNAEAASRADMDHESQAGPRPVSPEEQPNVDGLVARGRMASVLLNRQEDWKRMYATAAAGWRAAREHPVA